MTPTPVSDEFDMIFGAADGTDDEAVKSRLAISPPKLRSASSLKISSSSASVPSVEVIGRTEDDQVDYELESSNEQVNETPRERAIVEPAGYGSFLDNSEKTPKKTVSVEAGSLESVANILSRRPPKLSVAAPVPTRNGSVAMPTSSKEEEPSLGKTADPKPLVSKSNNSTGKRPSSIETTGSALKKSKQKDAEHVKDKESIARHLGDSEKKSADPTPIGYAKQNYDRLHVQAIEKKRLADTLREGKELPVYLKAMSLYATAYTQYELFGIDALEKWKGLVEFSQQIEKKCHGYKNDITLGLCSALIAWSHQCIIQILLKSAQQISVPAIDSLAAKQSVSTAQLSATLPLALTQISLHHDMVRQSWLKAVNLVPSISKYGFCIYSPVEDLVKTIDRYI